MRAVVTGGGGFIGWHLADALSRKGDSVQAWTRPNRSAVWDTVVDVASIDIGNHTAISRELASFSPDVVIHLAAQSSPGQSWDDPASTYRVNVIGTINLLEAVRALPRPPRVLLAGSSAEYAEPIDGRPIGEDALTEPNSPYGTSKLALSELAQLYISRYELDLIRFRPFYLVGPRKTGDVCSDFARRIVAIERGENRAMRVGSLEIVRDMIDVRDGIGGIIDIAAFGKRGEIYNICGSVPVTIGQILETYRGLANVPIEVYQDQDLLRPLEQKIKIGNSDKLRALGWSPKFNLVETLSSILQYWRDKAQ